MKSKHLNPPCAKANIDSPDWSRLSPDIFDNLLGRLNHEDYFQARQVCKGWNQAQISDHRSSSKYMQTYLQHKDQCYECLGSNAPPISPNKNRTPIKSMSFAPLVVNICRNCFRQYPDGLGPDQRLLPEAQARNRYCLAKTDLQPLRYAVMTNPVNPNWSPMHLYREREVRSLALVKWKSYDNIQSERHRRMTCR
jgi:hypothetical protein